MIQYGYDKNKHFCIHCDSCLTEPKKTELKLTNATRDYLKNHLENNYFTVLIKHKECFECTLEKNKLCNELSPYCYSVSYLNNTVIRNFNNAKNEKYPMIIYEENEIRYMSDIYKDLTNISYDKFLNSLEPLEIVEFHTNSSHNHIANQLRNDLSSRSLCLQLLQFYNSSRNSFEHKETYIYEIQRNTQTKRAIKN